MGVGRCRQGRLTRKNKKVKEEEKGGKRIQVIAGGQEKDLRAGSNKESK